MSISPALQRGGLRSGHVSMSDASDQRDARFPGLEWLFRGLAGNPPEGSRRGDLRLALGLAASWLAFDPKPRVVITPARQLRWKNRAATGILAPPQPVFLRNDELVLGPAVDGDAFERFLAGLGVEPSRHLVNDPDGGRALLVIGRAATRGGFSAIFLEFVSQQLVLDARTSGMADQFGLTNAECAVVDRLAEMEQPRDIAAQLGVSVNTVRTHIRRIYGKLGVSTQLQLMRTIMTYCAG